MVHLLTSLETPVALNATGVSNDALNILYLLQYISFVIVPSLQGCFRSIAGTNSTFWTNMRHGRDLFRCMGTIFVSTNQFFVISEAENKAYCNSKNTLTMQWRTISVFENQREHLESEILKTDTICKSSIFIQIHCWPDSLH